MFIQTETTPNPETIKFIPGQVLLPEGKSAQFSNQAEAKAVSPLAVRLLDVSGVESVFLGHDFISVTKSADAEWGSVKSLVLAALFEHLTLGEPVLLGETVEEKLSAEETLVVMQIKELLDLRVRPAVAQDGGDIVFHKFDKGIVWLSMRGACSGCPSSTMTLKMGVENMLRHYIPDVLEVRAVQD